MSGVNTMHTGWWVGEKFQRKTFRLRRRCRLPFQLAGCCWNMEMAAWLVALTSRDPEYSSLRPAQIKWCITHVIPSQMIIWYNTCSLIDGKDASVYQIDWIPTSPDVFHWSWLMSPYTQHATPLRGVTSTTTGRILVRRLLVPWRVQSPESGVQKLYTLGS